MPFEQGEAIPFGQPDAPIHAFNLAIVVAARRLPYTLGRCTFMEPPDAQEKRIRFGFGFIIGLFFGSFSWIAFNAANVYYFAAFVVAFALLCGFGALKYGDEFWVRMFTRSSRWWWWF